MDEIKILKEIGLNKPIKIVGLILMISFIIKIFYQPHIQRFIHDIAELVRKISGHLSQFLKPNLYEMLSTHWQKRFDIIDAIASYVISLIAFLYFFILVIMLKFVDMEKITLEKIFIYGGYILVFLVLGLVAFISGNRAIQKLKSRP